MKSATVKLKYPIQFGSETITEITIPPIKAKHLRGLKLDNMGMDEILGLLGKVTSMPDSQIDELSVVDVMELGEVLTSFLEPSQEIGNTQ